MSGDEKDPKNPVDDGGKGDSGDEKVNDMNVGPSNRDKKERNKVVEKRVKLRHPMMRCPMRSGRHGRRRRRSKRRRSLAPGLSLIQVMTPTPTPREEPHAPLTKEAHQGLKEKVIIEELLMTTPFLYLVSIMHQFIWASHLSLMAPDIINRRQKCSVT